MKKLVWSNAYYVAVILLYLKLIIIGLSPTDCLGALVLLVALQAEKVLSHLYPKRVDLYKEHSLIIETIARLQKTIDEQERDLTALKMAKGLLR